MMVMRLKKIIIITMILVAAAASGCVCCGTNVWPDLRNIDTGGGTGQYISGDDLVDMGKVTWFSYRFTSVDGSRTRISNIRLEQRNTTFEGAAARYVNASIDSPEASGVIEYYYDLDTREVLQARAAMNASGMTIDTDLPAYAIGDELKELNVFDPAIEMHDERYELLGTEAVTVPLGTYKAKKYRRDDGDLIWKSDDVPLPLKAVSKEGSHTSTLELTGWG
jgi:hypothetical protein